MNRRQLLQRAGVAALALGASRLPFGWAAPSEGAKKKILMYTRSQGFQHSVVTRKPGKLVATVDGQEKTYAVPATAALTIDDKPGKLQDVKKDYAVAVTLKGKDVTKVEVKTVTALTNPPPADAKVESGKVVSAEGGGLALAEQIVTDLGAKNGFDVVCEKDGGVFESKDFSSFDGFVFETQGNLSAEKSLDGAPPVTAKGKQNLLDAVAGGKAFVGCHCASDTWHSPGPGSETQPRGKVDPYIAMLGGEFIVHGAQQKSNLDVADSKWAGLPGSGNTGIMEEWYALKNFAPDLHVILVMDTKDMKGDMYQRPPYPETSARKHEKGRVFFTSLGHREDVWQSDFFQGLLLSGLSWALGHVDADVTANIDKVTPNANDLPVKK